jgi:hypothetical protein
MCKIMIMSGIKQEKGITSKVWDFVFSMSEKMSVRNDDGLGYAAVDRKGNLFGERWLNNEDAFSIRNDKKQKDIVEKYKGFLKQEDEYNYFGDFENNIAAITLHTRMATSGKQFFNTHPFIDNDTSLIHNGVISNTKELTMKTSTCDSECILNKYLEENVNHDAKNIAKVSQALQGYYACGVFSRDLDGNRILDIFKDSSANLSAAYIKEFETVVFSTDLTDIEEVCEELKLTISSTFKVESNMHIRINPLTGEVLETHKFQKRLEVVSYGNYYKHNSYHPEMSSSSKEDLLTLEGDIWTEDDMNWALEEGFYQMHDFYQDKKGNWKLIEYAQAKYGSKKA